MCDRGRVGVRINLIETSAPTSWTVTAQNLAEHARNPIHTDAGAQAAGFPRALVAGVTTYAYLTHPIAAAWGEHWLSHGGGELRLRRPVFDKDTVNCVPVPDGDVVEIQAMTSEPDQPRATFRAVRDAGPVPAMRAGDILPVHFLQLDGVHGTDRGLLAGDDLGLYAQHNLVHPAVWPTLANDVVHTEIATASWVHTRSIIRHHARVVAGSHAEIHGAIVDRFTAHGERVVVDFHIVVDGRVVASLEHEAIISLP
ncbi:MAG: hypothetical protein EBW68_01520 [Actinobacteria bacterium]|nr:hypothetical protein [Actinomycetota bacterium]